MKFTQKQELIARVTELLEKLIEVESAKDTTKPEVTADKPLEMLTVKECAALVPGLSEHTVRMLVKQDKVKHIRCGAGKRGKILVSKDSLLNISSLCKHKKSALPRTAGRCVYERIMGQYFYLESASIDFSVHWKNPYPDFALPRKIAA